MEFDQDIAVATRLRDQARVSGRYDRAIAKYETILADSLQQEDAEKNVIQRFSVRGRLGWTLMEAGRPEDAFSHFVSQITGFSQVAGLLDDPRRHRISTFRGFNHVLSQLGDSLFESPPVFSRLREGYTLRDSGLFRLEGVPARVKWDFMARRDPAEVRALFVDYSRLVDQGLHGDEQYLKRLHTLVKQGAAVLSLRGEFPAAVTGGPDPVAMIRGAIKMVEQKLYGGLLSSYTLPALAERRAFNDSLLDIPQVAMGRGAVLLNALSGDVGENIPYSGLVLDARGFRSRMKDINMLVDGMGEIPGRGFRPFCPTTLLAILDQDTLTHESYKTVSFLTMSEAGAFYVRRLPSETDDHLSDAMRILEHRADEKIHLLWGSTIREQLRYREPDAIPSRIKVSRSDQRSENKRYADSVTVAGRRGLALATKQVKRTSYTPSRNRGR